MGMPIEFEKALKKLQEAGQELNSAYYTEGYHEAYKDTGLWELIKIAEKIGNQIWQKAMIDEAPNVELIGFDTLTIK